MRHLVWIVMALLLLGDATAVSAAPRRLLATQGGAATLNANPSAAPVLNRLRGEAAATGSVRLLVGLRVPFAAEATLPVAEAMQQRYDIARVRTTLQTRLPNAFLKTRHSFEQLPFVAVETTPDQIDALAADPAVLTLTEDRPNMATLAQSVPQVQGDLAWAAGYRGLGQTVVVIDTGVDSTHPFLAGKVVAEACFSSGGWCPGGRTSAVGPGSARPCPNRECVHGTHVAGIAAGLGSAFSGVAKDANLIAIQVFSPYGTKATAYDSDIISALLYVYSLRSSYNIAAVNMSLGTDAVSSGACDDYQPAETAAIEALRSVGIATVVASGNSYSSNGISSPACISSAISVGAVSDSNWGLCANVATDVDKVTCYSNSSAQLSLLAPGSVITSSVPGRKYASFHGTSMAAPHVAGAWAILREKAPNASVGQILDALQTTGKSVTDDRNGVTTPRINVMTALDKFAEPRVTLHYVNVGSARGTVTFTPSGTVSTCRRECFNRFAPGTMVTLTAVADARASFLGWAGACSGTGSCTVSMSMSKYVYAAFYTGTPQILSYNKTGTGTGSVTLSVSAFTATCADSCKQPYGQRSTVTLAAQPAYGSALVGWSGACRGNKTYCEVRMYSAKTVTANFALLPVYPLNFTLEGTGKGTVSFTANDIVSCNGNCVNQYPAGTTVTLTAGSEVGSEFVGWSGACEGPKQTCIMTLNGASNVSANFRTTEAASAAP